jgi:hypothetical protein
MKRTKIFYWITTILIAGYMLFTAIPNAMNTKESQDLIHGLLGYPVYFIPFIGIAKILGSIVLVIPGLKRLKEWAYAGLLFDLVGATYSIVKVLGVDITIVYMILPIVVLLISYYLWRKVFG